MFLISLYSEKSSSEMSTLAHLGEFISINISVVAFRLFFFFCIYWFVCLFLLLEYCITSLESFEHKHWLYFRWHTKSIISKLKVNDNKIYFTVTGLGNIEDKHLKILEYSHMLYCKWYPKLYCSIHSSIFFILYIFL